MKNFFQNAFNILAADAIKILLTQTGKRKVRVCKHGLQLRRNLWSLPFPLEKTGRFVI